MAGSVYSSQPDLNLDNDRLIELTDSSAAPGVLGQTLLDSLSLEAQDDIDEMLAGRYVVPFDGVTYLVPAPIRRIHAARWRYLLFQHRDALNIPDSVKEQWAQEEKKLEDYATPDGGRVLLGAQYVNAASGPTNTVGTFSSDVCDPNPPERLFGRYKDLLGT